VLTRIYGEENWEATIGKVEDDEEADPEFVAAAGALAAEHETQEVRT